MTSRDLKELREALSLDAFAFAAVFGVHVSTVYRWESTRGQIGVDPGAERILEPLRDKLAKAPAISSVIGKKVHTALLSAGPLAGLYVIIGFLLDKKPEN